MTFSPDQVGDKGQQFVIEYEHEDGSVRPMGYASTEHGAHLMAEAWRKHPSAVRVWITDRHANA